MEKRAGSRWVVAVGVLALAVWALWLSHGRPVVRPPRFAHRGRLAPRIVARLRRFVGRACAFVYVLAVTVEVLVAPIPGTLLYAPA